MIYSKTFFSPEHGFTWLERDKEISLDDYAELNTEVNIRAAGKYKVEYLWDKDTLVLSVFDPTTECRITHRFNGII